MRRTDQTRSTVDSTTLYLRGIPVALVREAKAEAARQGKTLAAIVTEGMRLALRARPSGERSKELAGERRKELGPEMSWYERNRADLLERFAGEYVAIVDERVIDHDPAFDDLARRVLTRFGPRPIFMPRVVADGERIRLRSPTLRPIGRRAGARPHGRA